MIEETADDSRVGGVAACILPSAVCNLPSPCADDLREGLSEQAADGGAEKDEQD
jgi:hypothetical protein